jgi:hypothetical protein
MFPLTILGFDVTLTILNIPFSADFNITVGEDDTSTTPVES